jgi:drug/metabolite transporter (DMT)-like permease
LIGAALVFAAVLAAVAYTISVKRIPIQYMPSTIVKIQNLLGAAMFLPLFVVLESKAFFTAPPPVHIIGHLLFLAIFPSSLSFIFMSNAIRKIGVNRTNIFTNTIPIFTAIFSFFILGEQFSGLKIFGMVFVLAGVFLTQMRETLPDSLNRVTDRNSL